MGIFNKIKGLFNKNEANTDLNDLEIDNLQAKHSGDYDSDGIHEVYWKTADGTAYLRALMHADGNIRYANYQNEDQMRDYLTTNGFSDSISDIS